MPNKRSPKIKFKDDEKLKNINPETMKLWNKYRVDMSLRELSEKTIAGYENDFEHFLIFVYDNFDNKCVTDMDEDDITEFLFFCKSSGNNSRRIKRRMSAISAFYKFLRKKKIISENPLEFIGRPKKDLDVVNPIFLTQEQVDLMREKLAAHGNLDLQLYAMLSLSTMARVNAISQIRWEQIDFDNRVINEVLEKEGKVVTLFFSEEVLGLLLQVKAHRENTGVDDNGWVFFSKFEKSTDAISNGTLHQWCKKIGKMINVPDLYPHAFRKTGSSLLKNKGLPLEILSKLLHHESPETTIRHYIKEDMAKIQLEKDRYKI
jgi:site-specific recombinase XerD